MKFLRDAWYAAGWPDEIDDNKLVGRTLLGEPVVMFRNEDGRVIAMGNRCPHRFAPLHMGRHVGNGVQCGYHGLEFGSDGKCMRNPHGGGQLPGASVPVYKLVEKHGVLWIWMGNPDAADENAISDQFAFVNDPDRAAIKGYLHIDANYMLLVDNLMDLSHGLYLHSGSLSNKQMQDNFELVCKVEGDVVMSTRDQPNMEPPAIWKPALPPGTETIDYFSYNEWHKPSNVIHPVGCKMPGKAEGEDGGVSSRSAHMFTPETSISSHYFYCNSRDYGVDSDEIDQRVRKMLATAFGQEDKPMIEAQQNMIGDVDLMALHPVILPSDRPAVLVRRKLMQLIQAQESAAS